MAQITAAKPPDRKLLTEYNRATEKLFKVIIIGDPGVGKTSFIRRYVQNAFRGDYKATIGVDFALKIVRWSENQTIKLQLWDIAGQERFTWMTRVYYKEAQGCIIMFDLTSRNSFENAVKWKKDVDSKCVLEDGAPVPCMLLANKCDLRQREVDQCFIGWTETSAKDDLMVGDCMRFLIEIMMKYNRFQTTDIFGPSLKLSKRTIEESNGVIARKETSSCGC
ncbi:ras-related protein Rab-7L1-like isoform X2 [Daphnia pulex]|uniref:ras-related protein Rab-7L1-like isoform X2 n=1 Tax=Daphnia pulex TaxID=6669 RepID=UPI001EDE3F19|nr:ras-related protein Rab-7L1-like isoform X2 [Daphnia pulex]XP_046653685.1 ras-related protein Rab-7L1-like isoform X3 [Daphnia pulicaria]